MSEFNTLEEFLLVFNPIGSAMKPTLCSVCYTYNAVKGFWYVLIGNYLDIGSNVCI